MRSWLQRDVNFSRPGRTVRFGLVVRDRLFVDFIQLGISPKSPRPTTTVHRDAVICRFRENFHHR